MKVENLKYQQIRDCDEVLVSQLFIENYKQYPSRKYLNNLDPKKLIEFIEENKYYEVCRVEDEKSIEIVFDFTKDNTKPIMIAIQIYTNPNSVSDFDFPNRGVSYAFIYFKTKDDKFKEYDKKLQSFTITQVNHSNTLYILTSEDGCLDLDPYQINDSEIDFNLNYNDDFGKVNNIIQERLAKPNDKGIILLHGEAGTGKTSYIRWLINNSKKRVIYIPPNMAEIISDPQVIKLFLQYSNSILIIEDAENILGKRAGNSSQAISNLLNLSDGLLSDCASIQVIATFNTDVLNIDEALLRKGRLIARYEFKALEKERAIQLGKKLGVEITESSTLAEIYNKMDEEFNVKSSPVGFKSKKD